MLLSWLIRRRGGCSIWPFIDRTLETARGDLGYLFGETVGVVAQRCPSIGAGLTGVVTDSKRPAHARGNAATLLGRLRQPEDAVVMAALARELSDTFASGMVDPLRPAIRGLALVGGPTARTALLELAAKRTSAIRTDIAAALSEAGGPEVVPALVEMARSANPNVAIRALSTLGRVRRRSVVPALIALLKHRNPT